MVRANHHTAEVRNDLADPTDDAADGHSGGSNDSGENDDQQIGPLDIDAQGLCFPLAHGQQVDSPAEDHQTGAADDDGDQGNGQVTQADAAQAAHKPEGNGRELFIAFGGELDDGQHGLEEGGDHGTGQDQHQNRGGLVNSSQEIGNGNGQHAKDEGHTLNRHIGQAQHQAQSRAKAGTGGNAQNEGADQRILEHTLEGGTGHGQARTHEGSHNSSGESNLDNDLLGGIRPGLLKIGTEDRIGKNLQHFAGSHVIAAQEHGNKEHHKG